jgi:hypothetical protein
MIPLGGNEFPTNPAELAEALRAGLADFIRMPDGPAAVSANTDRLRIDLSGGVVDVGGQSPDLTGAGQTQPGPAFRSMELLAHPLVADGANLEFDLTAANVRFDLDRNRGGRPVMALAAATDGRVTIRTSRTDLIVLITAKARETARPKGVDVEQIELNLTQLGPRSLRLEAKAAVQTKALFKMVRGAVVFSGRVDIDDRLVARLSELKVAGEGMMIALAVNLVRGRVTALEGKEVPLGTIVLGGVHLHDVQLQVGDELSVTAAFGE